MNDEQAREAREAMAALREKWQAKEAAIEKWQQHWRTRLSDWLRDIAEEIADKIELPYPFPHC